LMRVKRVQQVRCLHSTGKGLAETTDYAEWLAATHYTRAEPQDESDTMTARSPAVVKAPCDCARNRNGSSLAFES